MVVFKMFFEPRIDLFASPLVRLEDARPKGLAALSPQFCVTGAAAFEYRRPPRAAEKGGEKGVARCRSFRSMLFSSCYYYISCITKKA